MPSKGDNDAMNEADSEKVQSGGVGVGSGFSKLAFAVTGRRPSTGSGNRQAFLLCGRRRKKSKTYLIGSDPFDISRDNCVAKVKSNVLGTQFNALR